MTTKIAKTNQTSEQPKGAAAVYCRSSKEEWDSQKLTIEQQAEHGTAKAKTAGYTVDPAYVLIDSDLKGKYPPPQWADKEKKTRPAFGRLVEAIEAGTIKAVIVRKLDRLARRKSIMVRFLELCKTHKVDIIATDETLPKAVDSSGTLMLDIMIAVAEMQATQIAENVRAAKTYQKEHGLKMCCASRVYGYADGPNKSILIDETKAAVVRDVYKRYLAGKNIASIVHWLNTEHNKQTVGGKVGRNFGRNWHNVSVRRMLGNPNYCGQGSQPFPKIVEPEIFAEAGRQISARNGTKTKPHGRQYLLSGFAKCYSCGTPLTAGRTSLVTGKSSNYCCRYKWNHSEQKPAPPMIDMACYEDLANVVFSRVTLDTNTGATDKDIAIAEISRSKLQSNLDAFAQAAKTGKLGAAEYLDLTAGLKTELAKAARQIAKLRAAVPATVSTPWADMSWTQKREHIDSVCNGIVLYPNGAHIRWHGEQETTGGYWFPYVWTRNPTRQKNGRLGKMRRAFFTPEWVAAGCPWGTISAQTVGIAQGEDDDGTLSCPYQPDGK